MSTPKRASASCPFCSWSTSRSYNLPYHIITQHSHDLKYNSMAGHYVSCYSTVKNKDFEFLVCLTCHGGSMSDKSAKQRAEWITKHAKNDKCKHMHKKTLLAFKQSQQITLDDDNNIQHQDIPHTNSLDNTWDKLKQKSRLNKYITEIEDACNSYHDYDNEPYIFNVEDGMEQLVISAMGYKKHITQLENKIKTMETEHERQLMEMRDRIAELERTVRDLQVAVRQEAYKAQNAQARCDQMERELNRYRERYPPPPDEDPV